MTALLRPLSPQVTEVYMTDKFGTTNWYSYNGEARPMIPSSS